MNKIYTKVEREMRESYFPALKMTGVTGIVIPYDKIFSSNIHFAKKHNLYVWIEFGVSEMLESKRVEYNTMGVGESNVKIKSFSFSALKDFVLQLPRKDVSNIDGFIVKYPLHPGMLWDESFRMDFYNEFSNYIEEYIPVLFEEFDNKKAFRYWYYDKCHNFIYKNYVKPAIDWARRRKLKLSFDFGVDVSDFFYFKNHISIIDLLEKGVSLCLHHSINGITEHSILLSKYSNCFVYTDTHDFRLDDLDINIIGEGCEVATPEKIPSERVLLVKPSRAIAENYYDFEDILYFSNECSSVRQSFNGTFYTDSLHEKGFEFEITNEKYFDKNIRYKDGILKYKNTVIDQILLCEGCILSDKMYNLLKRLNNDGISINNSKLIDALELNLR